MENKFDNTPYYLVFLGYGNLLREAFQANDLDGFKYIYNDYENLEMPQELSSEFYKNFVYIDDLPPFGENDKINFPISEGSELERMWVWAGIRFALYSWITHSFTTKIVSFSSQRVNEFLRIIESSPEHNYQMSINDPTVVYNIFMYLYYNGIDTLNYDRWEWHGRPRFEMKVYSIFSVSDWISRGLYFYLIRNGNNLSSIKLSIKSNIYQRLFEVFEHCGETMESEFEKNMGLVGNIDKVEFGKRTEAVSTFINNALKEYYGELNKYIVKEPLDNELVISFIQGEQRRLSENSEFYEYFEYFHAHHLAPSASDKFREVNYRFNMESGKRTFIKNYYMPIYGFSVIRQVAMIEDYEFLKVLQPHTIYKKVESKKYLSVIDEQLAVLSTRNVSPSVIIIPREWLWRYRIFESSSNYREALQDDPLHQHLSQLAGYYHSIPVAGNYLDDTGNGQKVLIADFYRAFTRDVVTQEKEMFARPQIEVQEIGYIRAQELLKSKDDSFCIRSYGTLTEEEALAELQTGIDIVVQEELQYEIRDSNAFICIDIEFQRTT